MDVVSPPFRAAYTSWGKRGSTTALYVESGPEVLGEFGVERATVDDHVWALSVTTEDAVISCDGQPLYVAAGNVARDKRISVSLGDREVTLLNEHRTDWVVEDSTGAVVAQFSGGNNGVRRAIVELTPDGAQLGLGRADVAALSWFARIILERRLGMSSMVLTIMLVAASLVAILAFLL
ncbi:hypothetical protein ACUY3K_09875 [Corynebacterium uberis]|uniref:hypothetical protein n=1 Tax=Corynebacterium TaxID=1716 RepID=UPI001D0ABB50|nr:MULTISPECIES: hypothetical protein [Corynebacterium]MCZ9308215.1 hypothetical protein [Corynebacterium sp. c6VSa_13]UDL73896.1 hypothetical protein LH391_01300 [Corynebacterium uberis]UDL75221.1 hypothetical protein LH393_08115 [Corynebacterium uberis]UDL77432.1 hypothetical protein LH394_08095 [Corynebacterium uberis]UDL79717.1 hypothetical protein LH392_08520 [Corynebacterium uberis]